MKEPLAINSFVTIPIACLEMRAVRSSGPGGQNVNKVSTKVELRFDIERSPLTAPVRQRLQALAHGRLDAEGRILITSQKTRDQIQNLEDAREKLRILILRALIVPTKRTATRPTRGSKERRLKAKQVASDRKRQRRTPGDDGP